MVSNADTDRIENLENQLKIHHDDWKPLSPYDVASQKEA